MKHYKYRGWDLFIYNHNEYWGQLRQSSGSYLATAHFDEMSYERILEGFRTEESALKEAQGFCRAANADARKAMQRHPQLTEVEQVA